MTKPGYPTNVVRVPDMDAKQAALTLATNPLRKTFAKLVKIAKNLPTGSQLKILVMGDSLGALKPKFIVAQLRDGYNTAGVIGLVTGGAFTFPHSASAPTATAGATDYTKTPSGGYTTLASSGQAVGAQLSNTSTDYYPFKSRTSVTGLQTADRIKVYYTKESGAGTFDIQVSADGTNWTTVQSGVSAANATTQIAVTTVSISAQQVLAVRALWASGSVKIWAVGALSTTAAGIIAADLSYGGIDMAQFASTTGCAAILNDLAPDLMFFEARDQIPGVGVQPAIEDIEALFSTLPERIYSGINNWNGDTTAETVAYNLAVKNHATATGAFYFDTYEVLGSYATSLAAGLIISAGDNHPSDAGSGLCAGILARQTGLDYWINEGRRQFLNEYVRGGVLYSSGTPINNSGTSVTTMHQYQLPAGVISRAGDTLEITSKFQFSGNSENKRIKFIIGSTEIFDLGTVTQGGWYDIRCTLTATAGGTTHCQFTINNYNNVIKGVDADAYSIDLAAGALIKFTGESSNATGNNNIRHNTMRIEYIPNNQ